jgi:hypothetical protein
LKRRKEKEERSYSRFFGIFVFNFLPIFDREDDVVPHRWSRPEKRSILRL